MYRYSWLITSEILQFFFDRGVGGWGQLYPNFFGIFGFFLYLQGPLACQKNINYDCGHQMAALRFMLTFVIPAFRWLFQLLDILPVERLRVVFMHGYDIIRLGFGSVSDRFGAMTDYSQVSKSYIRQEISTIQLFHLAYHEQKLLSF